MVNVLWEVAYGVSHEALHLDSLEDFNATEADLMDMKNNIPGHMEIQGQKEDFIPQTHVHLHICGLPRSKGPPWEKLLPLQGPLHLLVPFAVLVTAWVRHHHPSSGL